MSDVVRIMLACRDRRQAFRLGYALLRERLAASMTFGTRAADDRQPLGEVVDYSRIVLLTCAEAVPFLEAKVLELHPADPPPLTRLGNSGRSPGYDAFVRRKVVVPTRH